MFKAIFKVTMLQRAALSCLGCGRGGEQCMGGKVFPQMLELESSPEASGRWGTNNVRVAGGWKPGAPRDVDNWVQLRLQIRLECGRWRWLWDFRSFVVLFKHIAVWRVKKELLVYGLRYSSKLMFQLCLTRRMWKPSQRERGWIMLTYILFDQ